MLLHIVSNISNFPLPRAAFLHCQCPGYNNCYPQVSEQLTLANFKNDVILLMNNCNTENDRRDL